MQHEAVAWHHWVRVWLCCCVALSVRAGVWNLAMVLAIARLHFVKDTVGSLMATN